MSKSILWQAITLDPNLNHALDTWLALIYKQEGDKKYEEALRKVETLPNSWLSQLYLVSLYLTKKNISKAMPLIQHILDNAPIKSEAIYGLSGELGKNGYCAEIIDLILPRYIPEMGCVDGVIHNILSTFYELKMAKEGLSFIKNVRDSFKAQNTIDKMHENTIEEDLKMIEIKFKKMIKI